MRTPCQASLKADPDPDPDPDAALHEQTYSETVDAATLIPYMLESFMAGRDARYLDLPGLRK